jgi:Protein of unknown function (DUF3551)
MRHLMFAAASAACILTGFGTLPAAANESRYCLQSREWGYPGNCQFSTYEQCLATASGTDAGCGINPRYAFARQRGYRGGYRDGYRAPYPRY